MEEQTKLGIILGCSLGGAAVLVAGTLTLVCCLCARRKRAAKENAARGAERLEDVSYNKDSLSKSGMPPGFQPQFIGNGPQQWRNNYSMTAAAAGVIGSNQDDVRRIPTNPGAAAAANPIIVSSDKPVIKPWYQKTLGRARQLFDNGTSAVETRRESSEILVGSSAGNLKSGPSSAYILSKRVEDKHLSNASSESSGGQTTHSYSSQSTLLANDFAALTPHNNPTAASNIAPCLASKLDNSPATTAVSDPALHASSLDAAPSDVDIEHNPTAVAISDPGPTSGSNLATPTPDDLSYNATNLNGNLNLHSTVDALGETNPDNNSTSFDSSPVLRNSPDASSDFAPPSSSPLGDAPAPDSTNLDIYRPVLPTQPAIYSPALHLDQPDFYTVPKSDPGAAAGSDPTLQQLSLPRPVLINEGGLRQRVHSFLPPAVPRKPFRAARGNEVDAGNERGREKGFGVSAEPVVSLDPSSSTVVEQSGQRLNVEAVIEPIPRSQQDSQLADEKSMIGEAFKFLDDVE